MKDLFGNEIEPKEFARTQKEIKRDRARKYSQPRGNAAPKGSGPEGETCGSCENCYATRTRGAKTFFKCALVKPTNGAATDIRKKWPACARWKPIENGT